MTSAAHLQREAEATRSGLSRTLDELKSTMTTTAISAGAGALAKEGGAAIARAAVKRATAQPLGMLLIWAGLFLLLKPRSPERSYQPLEESAGIVRRTAHDAQDRVSDAVAQGKEALAGSQERVRETVQHGRERAAAKLATAEDKVMQTKDALSRFVEEQPILAAACAVAVGAALGASLPLSDLERSSLGETGAKVQRKGREVASQVADTVSEQLVGHEAEAKVGKVAEVVTRTVTG